MHQTGCVAPGNCDKNKSMIPVAGIMDVYPANRFRKTGGET
jgi:hypothetical protein